MPAPELLVEAGVLLEYLPGSLPLYVLRDLGYGDLRGHRYEDVDVLSGDMAPDDGDTVCRADFPYQIAHAFSNTPSQYGFPVLGGPHQVVFEVEDRMGPLPVQFHGFTVSLLERFA